MADALKRLYQLRGAIRDAQTEERRLTEMVTDYMHEVGTDALDLEGAPACVLKSRSTGLTWDVDAIRAIVEQRPQEWRRCVDLGAVTLRAGVLRQAVMNGNLLGLPEGGIEGMREYLTFEDKR